MKNNYQKYCKYCGDMIFTENKLCRVCGMNLSETDKEYQLNFYDFIYNNNNFKQKEMKFFNEKIKINKEFNQNLYEEKEKNILNQQENSDKKYMEYSTPQKIINRNQNTPKCPTCQSSKIKKISTTAKVTNTVMFGIFGQKRKRQFHCNNCGYEW